MKEKILKDTDDCLAYYESIGDMVRHKLVVEGFLYYLEHYMSPSSSG